MSGPHSKLPFVAADENVAEAWKAAGMTYRAARNAQHVGSGREPGRDENWGFHFCGIFRRGTEYLESRF